MSSSMFIGLAFQFWNSSHFGFWGNSKNLKISNFSCLRYLKTSFQLLLLVLSTKWNSLEIYKKTNKNYPLDILAFVCVFSFWLTHQLLRMLIFNCFRVILPSIFVSFIILEMKSWLLDDHTYTLSWWYWDSK